MILSHVALSCFSMSSYRAIWTHFSQISIFLKKIVLRQVLDSGQVLDLVLGQVLDLAGQVQEQEPDKWVHMARYELILKLDGALWLRIILKPLLAPKGTI